jgi:hypothetical protein
MYLTGPAQITPIQRIFHWHAITKSSLALNTIDPVVQPDFYAYVRDLPARQRYPIITLGAPSVLQVPPSDAESRRR